MTLGISVVAFANDRVEILSEQTQVKTISRDEFLKLYADEHNISFSEADKRDKEETIYMLQEENKKHGRKNTSTVTPRETKYLSINKDFYVANHGHFTSILRVGIHVKVNRYHLEGYGDYQKFSEITSKGVKPSGSGTATLEDIAFTTRIGEDSGYENEIIMLYDGIVEYAISASLTGDATKAGFTIRGNVGTTYYCRKPVKINYTFNSNVNLN